MAEYKLYYFPVRGRAEVCRIMFTSAGVKFEDVRISQSEWPEKKKDFPNGQLPFLELKDGKTLTQSMAIARFVAKKCNYYGKTDWEQAMIDQILYTANEIIVETINYVFEPNEDKKKEKLNKLLTESVPKRCEMFEKWLKDNGGGDAYFVGKSLSLADIVVYENLTSMLMRDTNLLDKYPKLSAHRQRIAGLPRIKEYLAKRECTEF